MNDDVKTVLGYPVDFLPAEIADLVEHAQIRDVPYVGKTCSSQFVPATQVEIKLGEEWFTVVRTDLKDDVAISCALRQAMPPADWIKQSCTYGARVYRRKDGRRSFGCIAAFSDG